MSDASVRAMIKGRKASTWGKKSSSSGHILATNMSIPPSNPRLMSFSVAFAEMPIIRCSRERDGE